MQAAQTPEKSRDPAVPNWRILVLDSSRHFGSVTSHRRSAVVCLFDLQAKLKRKVQKISIYQRKHPLKWVFNLTFAKENPVFYQSLLQLGILVPWVSQRVLWWTNCSETSGKVKASITNDLGFQPTADSKKEHREWFTKLIFQLLCG